MTISERQQAIIALIGRKPNIKVRQLAQTLNVSEPTVRRDLTDLDRRGLVIKFYGGAKLTSGAPDREIPFLLRENEGTAAKDEISAKAAQYVRDGMVIMLDGSTSAYSLVPHLCGFKDLIVVTSGAKTAVALAEHNIRTYSTGGCMIIHSFSYVGEQAENFVKSINADICFFSCRGVSNEGMMSDVSVEEVRLRKIMLAHSKKKHTSVRQYKIRQNLFL